MTKRVDWPPHVRAMLAEELRQSLREAQAAKEQFKVRVFLAVEQGVTTRDIASRLGISQAAVSKYRIQGEAAIRERQAQV
ncbi:hypothetical protein ACWEOV_41755 [Streptomyces sp. NPDC004365]